MIDTVKRVQGRNNLATVNERVRTCLQGSWCPVVPNHLSQVGKIVILMVRAYIFARITDFPAKFSKETLE